MMKGLGRVALVLFLLSTPAGAERLEPGDAPEPLRPWVDWVLRGHETELCPFLQGGTGRACRWPSRLSLSLDDRSGRFTQDWLVLREAWAPLPGDEQRWPLEVSVDGKPAVVTPRDGVPSVRLERGMHTVAGHFEWDSLPEILPVPAATGLVSLRLRDQLVPFPDREPLGQLWLQKRVSEGEESRLDVLVHRKVTDGIPLELETRVELRVSGKNREMLLGHTLPPDFVPMALEGPLPARLEPDGRLRVQVRPGRWLLRLRARHDGPAATLELPAAGDPWAAEEVWAFEAQPDLRLVTVEGAPAIDPQQTELPAEWRSFPAYLMKPGSKLTLDQKRRGDSDPAPDQLTLRRTWWLDFDGGGFSIRDAVSGSMSRGWRLEMAPPMTLGRVAVDGQDQLLTRLGDENATGVEIRAQALSVEADSRLDGPVARVPAIGWRHDFQEVTGQLRLPPGWRLFHAGGVDDVSSSWVTNWTLLDLFLVLVTAIAFARLAGAVWGAVSLVALGLSYPEAGAPSLLWILALTGMALDGALGEGRFRGLVRAGFFATVIALVLVLIPFMVGQVRQGFWPVLEFPWSPIMQAGVGGRVEAESAVATSEMNQLRDAGEALYDKLESRAKAPAPQPKALAYRAEIDPNALIPTGPGVPRWTWGAVELSWRGPVQATQEVSLRLLSPRMNLLLALLRVGLLAALVTCVVRFLVRSSGGTSAPAGTKVAAAMVLFLAVVGPASARADFPPAELLEDLRGRLLDNPECYPQCASIPRLRLEASSDILRLRLEIDAAADTAVPLPGSARGWSPATTLLDGAPAPGLTRAGDGSLWLRVVPGKHQVLMEGPLPSRDSIELPLPLRPRRVEASASGWTLVGLREDGGAEDTLQLVRTERERSKEGEPLQPAPLPAFVRIERTLRVGLSLEVDTVVSRMTPAGMPIVLEVPLLPGESVTSADVRVENERVLVSLPPLADGLAWHSILEAQDQIALVAPDSVPWVEVWRLDLGSVWHAEVEGIPVVHQQVSRGSRVREWRPWPGEKVTVALRRPAAVPGATLTIDHAKVDASPGLRATDVTLTLEVRSSRGAQHPVTLPEGAELQEVTIDGASRPIRQEGRVVTLPLSPGSQVVTLTWREPAGITTYLRGPEVDVGVPGVNTEVRIALPMDRWTLWLGGARLGPAVLFWSQLVVVLLVAVGLGRTSLAPLGTVRWFLLGIGLSQVDVQQAAVVGGWLLVLGWRRKRGATIGDNTFNLFQIVLVGWTLAAFLVLVAAIEQGLLGLPEMQISGNGSSAYDLRWYYDRTAALLPRPWVVSVPLLVYRLAMLAWALWLAWASLGWVRWGWECFNEGGAWRSDATAWRLRRRKAPAAKPPQPGA